mgnify:CR=1 FL=1
MREQDRRHPRHAVQTFVTECVAPLVALRPQQPAARRPPAAPHFEHVHEVGGQPEAQRQPRGPVPVVGAGDALEHALAAQEAAAGDVDKPFRRAHLVDGRQRAVGQVGDELHVVLGDGRTQQRRLQVAQQHLVARHDARVVDEEALAWRHDVAEAVGDQDAVAVLQHVARQRRGVVVLHPLTPSCDGERPPPSRRRGLRSRRPCVRRRSAPRSAGGPRRGRAGARARPRPPLRRRFPPRSR